MAERDGTALHPLVRFIATGAYLGYGPIAPGTWGSLGCAVLLWFFAPEPHSLTGGLALAALLSILAFIALAVWTSDRAERSFGHDSSRIVIDEFAGFVLAVAFLPKSLLLYVVAFVLFRAFDIVKPFPARRLESLPGGVGIVMDDVVAGLYTNLLLRLMLFVRGW